MSHNDRENYDDNHPNVIKVPPNYEPPNEGLGYQYYKYMKKNKNMIIQYLVDTNTEDTYEDLLKRCIRTAIEMKSEGLTKDDVVCLCTHHHKNSFVPLIASYFLTIKVACLDPSLTVNDAAHLLRQAKPKIIFVAPESVDLMEKSLAIAEIQSNLVVFGKSDKYKEFSAYLEPNDQEDTFTPAIPDSIMDTALISFSSGSTGFPKGICLSHYALLQPILEATNNMTACNNFVWMNFSPLYWISFINMLTTCIFSEGTIVTSSKFDPKEVWFLIEKYKANMLFLSQVQIVEMYKAGRPEGIDTSSLFTLITAGGFIPETRMENIRKSLPGTLVHQAYGLTEIGGLSLYFRAGGPDTPHLIEKMRSCGKPTNGKWYKVVDLETGKILGPNETGELYIKSKSVMNGYYNLDCSSVFDDNGWFKTGDIVYYDEDQCFYVVDRIKEILKYRACHVPPAVVEAVLHCHPAVKNALVIGIPHEEDGDHPAAVVELFDEYKNVTAQEIEEFVANEVHDSQKLRGGVIFIKQFPFTPSGKIKRKQIQNMVLDGSILH